MCKNILCSDRACEVAYGMCHCGCAIAAPLLKTHIPSRRYIAGSPALYLPGHHVRKASYYDDPDRFWSQVSRGEPDACWEWQGSLTDDGYGSVTRPEQPGVMKAHRLAWALTHGPIPKGMDVCHNCPGGDNRACCNTRHHFLGTRSENIKDMWQKGRARPHNRKPITDQEKQQIRELFAAQGRSLRQIASLTGHDRRTIWDAVEGLAPERRRATTFTPTDVAVIRERLDMGEKVTALAREYGVTHGTISHIKSRKVFAHI